MKTIKLNIQDQNIFFITDPHFHHANIIKYCDRPFGDVRTMDSAYIQNWNKVVGEDDIVFIGGDFCFGKRDSWIWLLNALNGIKYLTEGNHDKDDNIPKEMFAAVYPIINMIIKGDEEIPDGQRIMVGHHPMLTWNHSHRGAWQVFGHVHGMMTSKGLTQSKLSPNQVDGGVDVHNGTPISYQQLKEIVTKQHLR